MQRFALHILTSLAKLSFVKFLMIVILNKGFSSRMYKENLLQILLIR
jgi:hypothetical protein